MTVQRDAVYAGGGVIWRESDHGIEVLLVHRERHQDVSLPKGKLDPGEMLPATAVRELAEETGIAVRLGPPLGTTALRQPSGRDKIVQFWAAEGTKRQVEKSTFSPNAEISALQWVPAFDAHEHLTYESDHAIMEVFAAYARAGVLRTFPIIVLRHAEAVGRSGWKGTDAARPLTPKGRHQARAVIGALRAYGVRRIISSPAERCMQTITPLAAAIGREVHTAPEISQDEWEAGTADIAAIVDKRFHAGRPAVLCSHRPVIPDIMRQLLLTAGNVAGPYPPHAATLPTAGFTVAHVASTRIGTEIIGVETHAPERAGLPT